MSPIYIFASGGPQLVDIPILLVTAYILSTIRKQEIQLVGLILTALFIFIAWVISVNMFFYLNSYSTIYIKATLQILYVTFIFLVFAVFFLRLLESDDEKAIFYVFTGLLLSIIVPLIITGKAELGLDTRHRLSFNNSNQLSGYTTVIMATSLVLSDCFPCKKPKEKFFCISVNLLVFLLGHYYVLLSASRSGLISILLIDLVALWKLKKIFLLPMMLMFFVTPALIANFAIDDHLSEIKMYKRLIKEDFSMDLSRRTTEGRFHLDDLSLVFGNGKIISKNGTKEAHNTIADITLSYGLIGGCLFLVFICLYLTDCIHSIFHVALLFALSPMSITHNTIRSRMLWIFLSLVYVVVLTRKRLPQDYLHRQLYSANALTAQEICTPVKRLTPSG